MIDNYLVYLPLPPIPQELLDPIDLIINRPSIANHPSGVPPDYKPFQPKSTGPALTQWLQQLFCLPMDTQYQVITPGIPVHRDTGNRKVAFNYIIDCGGSEVYTTFHDPTTRQIMESVCIKPRIWHRLKTDELHGVSGISGTRIAVSVTMRDYVWNDPIPSRYLNAISL